MIRDYRFSCLLGTLLLMMFLSPFVSFLQSETYPVLGSISITVLFSAVLFSATYAVSHSPKTIYVVGCWSLIIITIGAVNSFLEFDKLLILENTLSAGLLVYTLALLFRFLFSEKDVTLEVIAASLCGYMLLGIFWANMYSLLDLTHPNSFYFSAVVSEDSHELASLRFGTERSAMALYFSYVTLTTLGYGDVVPATIPARMLCTTEAITGQMYLAVLVARLVGLHIARSKD